MNHIYIDSGTSNTRAYLIDQEKKILGSISVSVGTKDCAIAGRNDVLVRGIREVIEKILEKTGTKEESISDVWISGMITNTFGLIEVEHIRLPLDSKKLYDGIYEYENSAIFSKPLKLVRGAKTGKANEEITFANIAARNNVRGEEIEVVGLIEKGIVEEKDHCVIVAPGSHTHLLYVEESKIVDILSNFTGELGHAIKKDTILAGEIQPAEKYDHDSLAMIYDSLQKYGFVRALYVIHATRVFDVGTDKDRDVLLSGLLAGSVVDALKKRVQAEWKNLNKIVIIGGPEYIESYRYLLEREFSDVPVIMYDNSESIALQGFLSLLKWEEEKTQERKAEK